MDSFSSNFINFAYVNNVSINTSVVRYAWNTKGGEGWVSGGFDVRVIGLRANRGYEQTGYLSNERVVIRDRRVPISTDGSTVAYYKLLVESVHDYYPFGWEKQLTTVNPYPFNYQGQLFDGDLGRQYYRYRNNDPMVARFWRVEPLIDSFPMWSGYGYMKGMVTYGIEEEGLWVLMIGFGRERGKILGGGEFGALIEGDWSGATGNTFVTWTEVWDIDDIKSVINEIDNYLSEIKQSRSLSEEINIQELKPIQDRLNEMIDILESAKAFLYKQLDDTGFNITSNTSSANKQVNIQVNND